MKRLNGLNPKDWFYGLRRRLRRRSIRAVFAGSACEQWVNGELYQVIAANIENTNLTAYPEWNRRQHDIAIFKLSPGQKENVDWERPVAIVECKLVYDAYMGGTGKKAQQYIERLLEQLTAESTADHRIGLLLGVWSRWGAETDENQFGLFRRALSTKLTEACNKKSNTQWQFTPARNCMETIHDFEKYRMGASKYEVGCVGQYVLCRRQMMYLKCAQGIHQRL